MSLNLTAQPAAQVGEVRPWADPNHLGNRIRPRVRCKGCGAKGCITAWGPWCFACNVKRMTHLCGQFDALEAVLHKDAAIAAAGAA